MFDLIHFAEGIEHARRMLAGTPSGLLIVEDRDRRGSQSDGQHIERRETSASTNGRRMAWTLAFGFDEWR